MNVNLARAAARRLAAAVLFLAGVAGAVQFAPAWAQAPAAPASAASAPGGSRNIYSAGGQVRPAGPVAGDFIAVGARVIVDHPVRGDATLAGGSVDVRAAVGDDVRAAGGDVSIESVVGGELFATGGNITLTPGGRVLQSAKLYGGSVTLDGKVDGGLQASAQTITLNGEIGGNVRLVADRIELGPNARINGSLSYSSPAELTRAEGAVIGGAVTREQRAEAPRGEGSRSDGEWRSRSVEVSGPSWVAALLTFLALLACAAVFLLVFPVFARRASDTIGASPWLVLGLGFGALVAVPVLAVLLFITLLGIPLGIAVMALYPVLLLAGFVVGVLFIARLALRRLGRDPAPPFGLGVGYFALALVVVMLASQVPFVGGLLVGLVTVAGIGGCVLELYRRRQGPGSAAGAAAVVPR